MKTRKLLALVLAIAVLASFVSVPVFAEGEGTALETLGILIGPDADGVTPEYLATTATRAQAALIDLRLEGNAAAALAFDGEETFTDAAEATAYWQPILEFLKATPASGWNGYEDGSFAPNAPITGMEFTKVLLVSLGYVEGVDFMYADVMTFAATVGLMALADKADADLTVEDLAVAIMEALGTKINSATDVTLLSQLVIDGAIDAADAVAAGFEVEEEAVVIVDAYASAINEVTVEMSTDVPATAVVTLKKGTAAYSVGEAVDGSTITLTALFNLPAGTYTVMVDDSSAEFEVMAQYAVDLTIGVDTIYDMGAQDLKVQLLDQYGNAMSLSSTNYSVFNQTTGYVFTPAVSTTMTITPSLDISSTTTPVYAAVAGNEVYVFVYDPASMLTVSGTVVVMEAPYIAGLEIGGVTVGTLATVAQTTLFEGTVGNVLAVSAVDQYGMPYKLTAADIDTGITYSNKVQVLSSNGTVVDPGTVAPNADGNLVFDALNDGQFIITLIIPDQSVIATSELITVYATPALDTITTAGPDAAVYAGEATIFAVAGFDQYGAAFDVAAGVTFTSTVDLFATGEAPVNTVTNEITFTADMAGTATVYYFLGGIFQGTFDVTVNAAAYPFQITGVDGFMAMEEGTTQSILSEDIEVIDQYGRVMADPFVGTGFTWNAMSAGATDLFNTQPSWVDGELWVEARTGTTDATGSETFVAKLIDLNDNYQVMTESAFSFDIMNVESEDVGGFEMALTAGTMYTGGYDPANLEFSQTEDDYYKYVTITGTYGEESVLLALDSNGLPTLIDVITSTNDAVEVISGDILAAKLAVDGTSTIKAWRNGAAVAWMDLALCDDAPDLTAIALVDAAWADHATSFTYTDQYGVALDGTDVTGADSPDGLVSGGYTLEQGPIEMGDDDWYVVIKWNGSLSATFVDEDAN